MLRVPISILMIILFIASSLTASPNLKEVKSFYLLVPEHSRTSGGTQPALSPDGKSLAFRARDRDLGASIWIIHDEAGVCRVGPWFDSFDSSDNRLKPWRLQLGEANPSWEDDDGEARNIDWSPDGRRLAFLHADGRMYLAENFDFVKHTAQVRIIAEPKAFEGESSPGDMVLPRWSPDGKKIAFLRCREPKSSIVSVLDPVSGQEVRMAEDAFVCGNDIWMQPWSPDSRYLAYTTGFKPGRSEPLIDIAVVSVDGKERRKITKDIISLAPSWSPRSDKLAFVSSLEYKSKEVTFSQCALFIVDSSGAHPTLACGSEIPSKEKLATQEAEIRKQISKAFEKRFGSQLDLSRKQRLQQGKMTLQEMLHIAMLSAAKEIGGDFLREIERYVKAPDAAKDGILLSAMATLTEEQQRSFSEQSIDLILLPISGTIGVDAGPVWSPDGKKIALVRSNWWGDNSDLVIVDVASGQERTVFTSHEIKGVSWSPDSGALILQARRLQSRYEENQNRTSVTDGYPEIWLLALD